MKTVEQRAHTAETLTRRVGPEFVANRSGGAAGGLTYMEGSKVFELANSIFGYDGWSTDLRELVEDFCYTTKDPSPRHTVSFRATVRVTLRDGSYHDDTGHGSSKNQKDMADAYGNAQKTAVTDATKRSLRKYGELLGLCLYDDDFRPKLKGMKKNPPRPLFDRLQRGGVGSNVLPITAFPPGQGPDTPDLAQAAPVPVFQQPMFPIPVPVNASAAGVTPASHTDRSQTADAEGEGEATEFAEGGEEDVADEGGNENEMAMAEDEYGYDDSGYLEACEQDEREKAAAASRVVSPKSPLVAKKELPAANDRFAEKRLAAEKKKAEAAKEKLARRNSVPLPVNVDTPVAPRPLHRNATAAPATHKKNPVVAAGTVASLGVGGSTGKLAQPNTKPLVSAAARLAPKRELESPTFAGREGRDPLGELPADTRDIKRPRQ